MDAEFRQGEHTSIDKLVYTIAEDKGVDPKDLPPIGHTIDVDALDSILSSDSMAGFRSVEFTFIYAGYEVTVRADETITTELEAL